MKLTAKGKRVLFITAIMAIFATTLANANNPEETSNGDEILLKELIDPSDSEVENLSHLDNTMHGFASYYSARLKGRRTTSGSRYNPHKLTAAHAFLPIGSLVRVINKKNGAEVTVTINDRCAQKPYHFIDLSQAAAMKIGVWGKGKVPVSIITSENSKYPPKSSL